MSKQHSKPSHGLTDLEINYKRTFGTTEGVLVLEDLKKLLKYGETLYSYKKENSDLHFESGRQSVINEILFILAKTAK